MERLTGAAKEYDWGSRTAIPGLRGDPPSDRPLAELWFGGHPAGATILRDRGGATLLGHLAADPDVQLGGAVGERYGGTLPYLLKLLAAARPLSLQVHPSLDQAAAGWERENELGIDPAAPERSFRDANHKPELIVALSPFEALVGFREPELTLALLAGIDPVAQPLLEALQARRIDLAVGEIYGDGVDLAQPVAESCRSYRGPMQRSADVVVELADAYPGDPGVAVAALLNLVTLQPGEGIFLGAGTPHAYVGGLGVEVMANSDNVVRGGLTSKYVDVDTFRATIRTEPTPPSPLVADAGGRYPTPTDEFALRRVDGPPGGDVIGPAIVLATDAVVHVDGDQGELAIAPTEAVWVQHGEKVRVRSGRWVFVAEVGATTL